MEGLFSDTAGWMSALTILFLIGMMIFLGLWVMRNLKE